MDSLPSQAFYNVRAEALLNERNKQFRIEKFSR